MNACVDLRFHSAYQRPSVMPSQFRSLVDLWTQSRTRYAERPLFGTKHDGAWRWTTYADLGDQIERCRAGLARLGVGRGDNIGMIADNRPEWAAACYATYGRGAAFVPMYEAQKLDEQVFILQDAGCVVTFVATTKLYDRLTAARADLPALRHVIGLDLPADHPNSFTTFCSEAVAPAVFSVTFTRSSGPLPANLGVWEQKRKPG